MCLRVALLRVDEGREEKRITDEEDGRVVADEVPVALFGVELHRETTWIPESYKIKSSNCSLKS